jgi:hypothetical protein
LGVHIANFEQIKALGTLKTAITSDVLEYPNQLLQPSHFDSAGRLHRDPAEAIGGVRQLDLAIAR